jgi:hypothetical protein
VWWRSGASEFGPTSTNIQVLQNATTHVVVSIAGKQLTVRVARVQVSQATAASLTATADLVFTGSTGVVADSHAVDNVTITQTTS